MNTDDDKLDWDDLIAEAERRIKELKRSVRHFREQKELGELFPLDYPKPPPRQPHVEL